MSGMFRVSPSAASGADEKSMRRIKALIARTIEDEDMSSALFSVMRTASALRLARVGLGYTPSCR